MYSVRILRRTMKDIASLPTDYANLISQHIDRLGENPRPPDAKKLKVTSGYSLRVGVYRVLFDINDETRVVTIYRVKHRSDAYR